MIARRPHRQDDSAERMVGRARGGFTLVELIIGVAVMAGLLAGAYLCLEAGWKSRELVETRADIAQNARVALAIMSADLRAACPLERDYEFVGLDREIGGMEADNVDFASHNYRPQRPGEGDFCEISYFVRRSDETGEWGLWRRRDPSPDQQPFGGGLREEIASGLRGLRLEYYDGFLWYDRWGMEPSEERRRTSSTSGSLADLGYNMFGMPTAVRITLTLTKPDPTHRPATAAVVDASPESDDGPTKDRPMKFQTVVFLNLEQRSRDTSTLSSSPSFSSADATDASR